MSGENNSLICPHCGFPQRYYEPETETDHSAHPYRCEECGERFVYSVIVTRQYFSYKDYDEYYN